MPFYYLNSIPGFTELVNGNDNINVLKLSKTNKNNQSYKIIKYDKNFLSTDLISSYGVLRSVILNSLNSIVSFAPPKSISSDLFMTKYPELGQDIVAEEFVEGTMVNVFWDKSIQLSGAWEIATRNSVGGEVSFYKTAESKTFRSMFLEAANVCNLNLNTLDPRFCYSFVLQHPDNRIVTPFSKPSLYLVEVYEIYYAEPGFHSIYSINIDDVKQMWNFTQTSVKFPQVYDLSNGYAELKSKYASMNTPYDVLGVMLKNKMTMERTKFRNPVYEQVRRLRGNQPKLMYQYLCLRQQGKVRDYLNFYPENKKEFSFFRDNLHTFTTALFQNYLSCYVHKDVPLKEFPDQYRTHMYHLHQIYINQLRSKGLCVTNNEVIDYVNKMHPSLQMYSLNYSMRKRFKAQAEADVVVPISVS
uniref:T4 RNA ligase 1-like N-terminal domain-containing protein n=1 Tax=viral metagenome TaxID=1070528 RepID=A0A6C0HYI7_9ZZZZ